MIFLLSFFFINIFKKIIINYNNMKFGNQLNNVKVVCINLKCRKDKKKYMKKQLKRRKLDFKFFNAEKHANPKRGSLESHLTVIKRKR